MTTHSPRAIVALAALATSYAALAESHLMRLADVSNDQIVFTYEDDLWLVPIAGGTARRITNDPGSEAWAKFSPDGNQIAFTAQYDGGTDVYVMDAAWGTPRRLTFHPAGDRVLGWWPDGHDVLFRSRRAYPYRGEEIYRVAVDGGAPTPVPVDRAGLASVSPDGRRIAYNRISREHHTWKRHRGGTAQDIWMGSLEKQDYRKIVDTDWSDNFPMWHGDAIYFASDREHGTLNIFKYDVATGEVTAMTSYDDYDVKYPSVGPGHIVYQYNESLHLLDLDTGDTRMIPVQIPSDLTRMRPEFVDVRPTTGSFGLSPSGVRMLLEARGEIFNLPVKDGQPINLAGNTSGSREKNAAWSPDGRWIAFLSDKTGEEEIYLVDQKGAQEWRQLTHGGLGFRMHLVWSPDSKHLMFADKFMRLNLVDAETGSLEVIDQSDYDDAWERWGIQDYVWSPDSQWIAYTKMEGSMFESIFLYSLDTETSLRLTSDQTNDWSPSFDPKGEYLYFLSKRTYTPLMGMVDQNYIFLDMTRPYMFILDEEAESPFAPEDTEEKIEEEIEEETGEDEEQEEEEEDAIDLDGIERRLVAAKGVQPGEYYRLEATEDGFLYLHHPKHTFSKYDVVTDHTGGSYDLYHYRLEDEKTKKVLGGVANYHLSANNKKLVYRAGSTYGVVDAGKKASVGDGRIDLSGVRVSVNRALEFEQLFHEAWRVERDWFYDANMHGLDWSAMREKYGKFIPFCGNRSDLNYLIGEMIAELNIGHTYVGGGDIKRDGKHVPTGFLGAEFTVEPGSSYYRISHIIPSTPGEPRERSPLDEPGIRIKEGDYLIAIDGEEITTSDNIFRALQHKSGKVVTLTTNDTPSAEDAQTQRVRTTGSEYAIRYREWVESRRAYVNERTGGRLGYVHIPDMGENGLIEFAKAWHPQYTKEGFIVDVRYNGGGFTGCMIIDRLERQIWAMTQPREGKVWRDPERVFAGPWIVIINEDTGSNGEMFAEAIKIKQLAPIIGMRTWGGSIGIEAHQDLVDGGGVTPPQFGLYGLDSRWLIEGRGVEPDIEVQNMPGDVLRGVDAQLDAAIDHVLEKSTANPVELPGPPPYPDKSRPAGS